MKIKIFRILTIIRPLVILKAFKKIITRNLQFAKKEILCRDTISKKVTLCNEVYDQIAQAFQELLEEL